MEKELKGKNILLISNYIFGYEQKIKQYLEKRGATVKYYNDRPSDDFLTKLFIRKGIKLSSNVVHKYYQRIIDENQAGGIDYVFFMRCESPYPEDLQKMRDRFTNAEFILYLSDAVINLPGYDSKKAFFNRIYSFDSQDCQNHPEMIFRPLFYTTEYKETQKMNYDIVFIGTLHSDRGVICEKVMEQAKKEGFSYYFRLYVQSPIILYARLLLSSNVRRMYKLGYVTTEKMPSEKVHEIEDSAKCVLDIEHVKQSGLTLRNVELVGMGKKMVTTNYRIKDYDFYNENNIVIIDRNNPVIDTSFFDKEYHRPNDEIYNRYSLEYWINQLFEVK